jgi:uncharacterized protein YndB with AHSA1/START domain
MAESRFVYVIFIRTTPEKLWQALTSPEFTRRYWYASSCDSDWTPGSPWRLVAPDGRVTDSGEVIECEPPRRYAVSWRHELGKDLGSEGYSRMSCEIEPQGTSVKLTVIHEIDRPDSKLIGAVSRGWPHILSSLKTLLETGEPLSETTAFPKGM